MIRILILFFFAIGSFTSCVTYNRCVTKFGEQLVRTDTLIEFETDTVKKEIIRIDTIRIAGEQVVVRDSIPCPELINKKISGTSKSGKAKVDIEIKNNILTVNCKTDSLMRIIELKDSIITIQDRTIKTIKTEKIINKPSWFNRFPFWLKVLLIIAGLIILLMIIKKIFKI